MSKIKHYRDMLASGQLPEDPFEAAVKRVRGPSEDDLRDQWNQRVMNFFGGAEQLRSLMLRRRARRVAHSHNE